MAFLNCPVRVTLRLHSPSLRVCTDRRSYSDVITKFSCLDGFTKFSKRWDSVHASSACRSSAIIIVLNYSIFCSQLFLLKIVKLEALLSTRV